MVSYQYPQTKEWKPSQKYPSGYVRVICAPAAAQINEGD